MAHRRLLTDEERQALFGIPLNTDGMARCFTLSRADQEHADLNKSEQRHALAQVICTFKQGRIADRGQDAQQFRASGLNLVIAAIVYWNSTYLADAVTHLRSQGQVPPAELLAHISPLTWEHIGFSGDFLWDRAAATAGLRRPLNLSRDRAAA